MFNFATGKVLTQVTNWAQKLKQGYRFIKKPVNLYMEGVMET